MKNGTYEALAKDRYAISRINYIGPDMGSPIIIEGRIHARTNGTFLMTGSGQVVRLQRYRGLNEGGDFPVNIENGEYVQVRGRRVDDVVRVDSHMKAWDLRRNK
jgi:hypothetical protein